MIKKYKAPPIKKSKSKISYGISKMDGVKSKSIGVMTPLGSSYSINKDPFSTTYSVSGTTKRGASISTRITKPKHGTRKDIDYGIQVIKKF